MEEKPQLIQIGALTFQLVKNPDGSLTSKLYSTPEPKEEGILLIPKERKVLGKFESSSEPGTDHYVIQPPEGEIYCTCFGFRSPNKCWHYRMVIEVGPEKITKPIVVTFRKEDK